MVLGMGTLIALWKKISSRWAWAAVLAAAAIGTLIVVIAPGNAIRRAQFPRSMDFAWAWAFLLGHLQEFVPVWFGDARLWVATFLLWMVADSVGLRPQWLRRREVAWHFWIPLGTAAAIVAMFFVPAYATGDHLPVRAYNDIYLAFVIGWFLTVLAVRERLAGTGPTAPRGPFWTWGPAVWVAAVTVLYLLWAHVAGDELPNLPRKNGDLIFLGFGLAYLAAFAGWVAAFRNVVASRARAALWAVLLIALPSSLLWTGNTPFAFRDLAHAESLEVRWRPILEPALGKSYVDASHTRLQWFDVQMTFRRDFLRQQAAAGRKQFIVAPIFLWPPTYFPSDLSQDPNWWANRELCPFFGIDRIALAGGFAAR
jgi:hypothetical protein